MEIPKKYFQDKVVLLLLSVNAFLVVITAVMIALRIGSGHADYIVQCRDCSNVQAISRFIKGGIGEILAFMVFSVGIAVAHTILSIRFFKINRQLTVVVLAMGTLLLVLSFIISYALLLLR
jgi:hypothetical protein